MFPDATNHPSVDKGRCRGITQLQDGALVAAQHLDVEILEFAQDLDGVIGVLPKMHDRQGAAAQRLVQRPGVAVAQFGDLLLGQQRELTFRINNSVDSSHEWLPGQVLRNSLWPFIRSPSAP